MTLIFFANIVALIFSFFVVGTILGAVFSQPLRKKLSNFFHIHGRSDILLARVFHNPVLRPARHPWEAEATFNPAAVILKDRTHLLYRAIGIDGVSRLGYASSANGIVFDERLSSPAYVAQSPRLGFPGHRHYNPVMYASGGSWGGIEDPRMVRIEGRIYVSFSVFDGWDFIRVGVISISEDDFIAKRFGNWTPATLVSPPGQIHKNWVLFPEKIHGQFAFIHSITPKIEIAYRDRIEDIGKMEPFIESWTGPRDARQGRAGFWDNHVRGAGPPPLKTDAGWLLFYHAVDEKDPGRYKLGAMLLDLQDPTKVLYRSHVPVLSPNARYENVGKPGIVYACGAVIKGDTLYVYYGGADKVVCVAFANLRAFLRALMSGEHAILRSTRLETQ
ncbi:MAG TPA: hypothetical protein VM103_00275 [Candidatus Paceibacterota bacterium]|nr:hypothetical protein [Candidatus Paceibacterota bacterium]